MKKFIIKFILLTLIIFMPIISCNYFVDPANIFHNDVVCKISEYLNAGNVVEVPANMDEGLLQEKRISTMDYIPKTVVIGSSHVMYIPFEYEDIYNAGMSGSDLGDYYAIVGLLTYYDKMPKRIVIGIDPWAFLYDYNDGYWSAINKYSMYQNNESFFDKFLNKCKNSKLKVGLSISYFRSSLNYLKINGHFNDSSDVIIADDCVIGNSAKIAPDGRRIPSKKEFKSVDDIEKDVDKKISSGNIYRFGEGFKEVPVKSWEKFEELIQYLESKGVEVHLYLPAWHPKAYKLFITNEEYSGVLKVEEKIRILGKRNNITVHGGYNPSYNGFKSDDFMDWLHLKPNKMLEDYQSITM